MEELMEFVAIQMSSATPAENSILKGKPNGLIGFCIGLSDDNYPIFSAKSDNKLPDAFRIEWWKYQRLCLLSTTLVKEGGFALNGNEFVYVQEIMEGIASIGSQRACPVEQLKAICATFPSNKVLPTFEKEFLKQWCDNPVQRVLVDICHPNELLDKGNPPPINERGVDGVAYAICRIPEAQSTSDAVIDEMNNDNFTQMVKDAGAIVRLEMQKMKDAAKENALSKCSTRSEYYQYECGFLLGAKWQQRQQPNLTKDEFEFITSILNQAFHDAHAKLQGHDLGDIERGVIEQTKAKCKDLMAKIESEI